MADIKKKLVLSMVQFLADQLQDPHTLSDAKESLEVAIQCLETAYGVAPGDPQSAALRVPKSLTDIFTEYLMQQENQGNEATESMKVEAERLKTEGNNLMQSEKFHEALECYTKAISIDGRNAVYYCNRAAAYSKMNDHLSAISDCNYAIQIDPQYSKAYARMGLAYASLSEYKKARDAYKRALELDPDNEGYQNNLKVSEQELKDHETSQSSSMPNTNPVFPMGGGMDFGSLLSNPALMNMATHLMQDPQMQNLIAGSTESITGLMSGSMNQGGAGMDALLTAGQQLAAQMQSANPELVETLRRQMGGGSSSQNNNNNTNQGPDSSSNP